MNLQRTSRSLALALGCTPRQATIALPGRVTGGDNEINPDFESDSRSLSTSLAFLLRRKAALLPWALGRPMTMTSPPPVCSAQSSKTAGQACPARAHPDPEAQPLQRQAPALQEQAGALPRRRKVGPVGTLWPASGLESRPPGRSGKPLRAPWGLSRPSSMPRQPLLQPEQKAPWGRLPQPGLRHSDDPFCCPLRQRLGNQEREGERKPPSGLAQLRLVLARSLSVGHWKEGARYACHTAAFPSRWPGRPSCKRSQAKNISEGFNTPQAWVLFCFCKKPPQP